MNGKTARTATTLYPILGECGDICTDDFWKHFYRDLSVGKTPRGIYISNGTVHTSNKRGGFSYSITDKAPAVIVRELHHLLTTHTSICSRRDVNKKRRFIEELEEELDQYDHGKWTSIKRKSVRQVLIINFVIELERQYSLGWPKTVAAYRTVLDAFESKTHTSKDIDYRDGKIRHIADIEYDEEDEKITNTRFINADKVHLEQSHGEGSVALQSLFESYVQGLVRSAKA